MWYNKDIVANNYIIEVTEIAKGYIIWQQENVYGNEPGTGLLNRKLLMRENTRVYSTLRMATLLFLSRCHIYNRDMWYSLQLYYTGLYRTSNLLWISKWEEYLSKMFVVGKR